MIKKFSDYAQEKLSHCNLKYDINETLDWYNLDNYKFYEEKLPDKKLSDLKILDLKTEDKFTNMQLFNIDVKRHVFTHEFYTVYFDIDFYLFK
jgi:hypothetical protein